MAELVYAFDLKSNGENHMGSSPISGTISELVLNFPRSSRDFFITERSSDNKRKWAS